MNLKINPEYALLVPKPSTEDYVALEASIISHSGAFESIKVNTKNEILDGHTRHEICNKHKLIFKTETVDLPTVLDEKIYVVEANLQRRQLNPAQRIELNFVLEPLLTEKGRQNIEATIPTKGEKGFQPVLVQKCTNIDVLKTVAVKSKTCRRNVAKYKKIREKAPEKIKQEVLNGKRSINSAYAIVKEQERQEARNAELSKVPVLPENVILFQDDFTKIDISENSIQLILSDPPYPEEYLPLWDSLAEFAEKVLVEGGYLITYCGHYHLPTVLNKLSKHLKYFWTIALTQKQQALIHSRHVFCCWKPLLIFYKPPLSLPKYFGDVIKGEGREKTHHAWQQGLPELEQLINTFCPENGVILDPFAGSGTTLLAAKQLKRKCIGIESNPETYKIMAQRLSE